jgi:hypothetical protein
MKDNSEDIVIRCWPRNAVEKHRQGRWSFILSIENEIPPFMEG